MDVLYRWPLTYFAEYIYMYSNFVPIFKYLHLGSNIGT